MKHITHQMHNWIVENVQGTCDMSADHELEFNKAFGISDMNDDTFSHALTDAEVFLCEDCGWYCEASEHTDDGTVSGSVCRDCCPGEFD